MNDKQREALMPTPDTIKVSDKELIVRPLQVVKLLKVVKYVESNIDLVSLFGNMQSGNVAEMLEKDVYPRLNELVRLMVPDQNGLSDEWCLEHFTNAHYWAVIMAGMRQNKIEKVFQKAVNFLETHVDQALSPSPNMPKQ